MRKLVLSLVCILYTANFAFASEISAGATNLAIHVITRSTLAFARPEGHRFTVGVAGGETKEVNFNSRLNEKPENIYSVFYPTVARRVVDSKVHLAAPRSRKITIEIKPLDPGIAFEQIVVEPGLDESSANK